MSKATRKWALWAVLAAIVGYVSGILTAPKSGKETRKDIKDVAQKGMAEAEKRLKQLHTQLADIITQAKDKANSLNGTTRKELQVAIEKAMAIKQKAREVLSAVHEGGAENKDLDKAISDANKAIENLKNYLKK